MTTKQIGVVDYGSGNLRSVSKALEATGAQARLVNKPSELDGLAAVVVPGVGSFGDCAANLRATGLWDPVREWILAGRPYLGICLGYQLLFESSEESPNVEGLGIFKGSVVKFQPGPLKVPHMGWNPLYALSGALFEKMPEETPAYFVHSYYPVPSDSGIVSATCEYGVTFAAAISRGAVHATQFHPEKSQASGLAILRNFQKSL